MSSTGRNTTDQNNNCLLPRLFTEHREPASLVYVVVLAWDNFEDTAECLGSLQKLTYPHYCTLLVDNGSTDGTSQRVKDQFPEVIVIENGVNLGVPAGYNVGFRYALQHGADHVVMLNNDTIVDPVFLDHLVSAAQNPNTGLLVPTVFHYGEPYKVWSAGARYRKFPPAIIMETRQYYPSNGYHKLDYAIGCCLLITRRAFEQVGLLDETYRFMWEDHDFSKRIRKQSLDILQVPKAKVWHKVSRTTRPGTELFWEVHGESGAIFYRRHYRFSYLFIAVHLGYFALREFFFKRRWQFIKPFLRGLRQGLRRPLREVTKLDPYNEVSL